MTLLHLFLIHRYKAAAVHYVSPTEDNRCQAEKMRRTASSSDVHDEVGDIIVADVDQAVVGDLVAAESAARERLMGKQA